MDEANGLLPNDTLTLFCEVRSTSLDCILHKLPSVAFCFVFHVDCCMNSNDSAVCYWC